MRYQVKGQVQAPFAGYSEDIARQVGYQHTGQDEKISWNAPWFSDNDGYVYKVFKDRYPAWQGVYVIVEDKAGNLFEVVDGHFNKIMVSEGDHISRGQLIGYEGNAGEVYSGGRRITDAEKMNGSTLGHHNHRGVRPIRLVDRIRANEHYLRTTSGVYAKYKGQYMEIINKDNGSQGYVDPVQYMDEVSRLKNLEAQYLAQGNTYSAMWTKVVYRLLKMSARRTPWD